MTEMSATVPLVTACKEVVEEEIDEAMVGATRRSPEVSAVKVDIINNVDAIRLKSIREREMPC